MFTHFVKFDNPVPHEVEDEEKGVVKDQSFFLNGYDIDSSFEDIFFRIDIDQDGLGCQISIDKEYQDLITYLSLRKVFKRVGEEVNRTHELLLSKDPGDIATFGPVGKIYEPVEGVYGKAISPYEMLADAAKKMKM